ncbi:PREDICTED: protein CREG2 [Elephantulus edwardii]|uniref:protein CREG2 n=1 Tax=Elephantulus edwardii TaxID=28737 RepID=UPI0003F0ED05|nr:PREDICTED: protein CREG2 [Elephantulus edwardii]
MSVRGRRLPARAGAGLPWLLCCIALLSPAAGYVIVSSVSWAVTNEVDEELDSASTEEALPALLEDSGSIWQQSFPASAHKEDAHLRPRASPGRARPPPGPPRMFSYRREGARAVSTPPSPSLRPGTARFLAHSNAWGCLATVSTQERIQGLPFGNCLPISDGPINNSTGIPFFYLTAKDPTVSDLLKNPMASLTLPESEAEFCRRNIVDPEDPRCVRLTLTGQMVAVSPEEAEFARQAMFSRHPVMRKWPRQYEWFFMKMRIQNIWLQKWYGGVSEISREEYFKEVPTKA